MATDKSFCQVEAAYLKWFLEGTIIVVDSSYKSSKYKNPE